MKRTSNASIWLVLAAICTAPLLAGARTSHGAKAEQPLNVFFIDQIQPQFMRPAWNGIEERRRGPIFKVALEEAVRAGKLPPVNVINRDLSLQATQIEQPKVAPGEKVLRIYLTQWSQTRLGGVADTEILCRFFVEEVRDGKVTRKLGPFFARKTLDVVTLARPQDVWAQYQAAALEAIDEMAPALGGN